MGRQFIEIATNSWNRSGLLRRSRSHRRCGRISRACCRRSWLGDNEFPACQIVVDLLQLRLERVRNTRGEIVERRDADLPNNCTTLESPSTCRFEQINQTIADQFFSTGDQAGMGFRNGVPLVSINTDTVQWLIFGGALGNFGSGAVARFATGSQYKVCALA